MATPDPTQAPINNSIKSAARKLPIKRKTPTQPQQSSPSPLPIPTTPIDPSPIPNPNPNPNPNPISPDPSIISSYDDCDDLDDDLDDEPQQESINGNAIVKHHQQPPFKFHRIWSEPDELRFLQGLLGCWSQGLVFPRDLNIFYDRFSESMPQPYTRSQLSEKLRRLRKKFRIMSSRIARGQDPNRLAPHDRDLLHLCTRLWDPKHASTSPFSAPDPVVPASGASGNKRRRPNPRVPPAALPKIEDISPPLALPAPASERNVEFGSEKVIQEEKPESVPVPAVASVFDGVGKGGDAGYAVAKAVLDVFDGSLEEMRMTLRGDGSSGSGLEKRWQEQRVAELDVFARRLRLMLEESLRN